MTKITEFQNKINQLIDAQDFKKNPTELYSPIEYVMSQSGKRLRPVLTLLACDLFNGNIEKAIYPALAIEIFHNFTLVHDDIMDKAPIRRGKDTVYKKWNSDIAILAGDTMFAMAYQYATKTDRNLIPGILEVFSKTAIEVCEGQQYDMNFESSNEVTISDYLEMIRLKTAVLLGASLEIGAVCAGADAESIKNIYDFGINLGIAFQLKDDLLDSYGNTEQFGKMKGGDIASNKKTFLYLKALELAAPNQLKELTELYSNSSNSIDSKISDVIKIFDQLNIKEEVSAVMEDFFLQSLRSLEKVKADNDKKQALQNFATTLYHRNH